MMVPHYAGLAPLAGRYDGFILDLWGVVHNGRQPYPGAVDCLRRLRAGGGRVLLLSNAPRPVAPVAHFLAAMGVDAACYDDLLTSGELVRQALADGSDRLPGRRCLSIGPERDAGLLDGLNYARVTAVAEADFLLCSGLADDERETVEDYRPLLTAARARDLPMVCANPDLTVMRGTLVVPCAGLLAQAYAAQGGTVHYHGKPHRAAYTACFNRLGLARERVLAIGDSLRTDIAGANAAGIDSLLVPGGIHAEEWRLKPGELPPPALLERAFQSFGQRPTGVLAALRWREARSVE